MSNEIKNNKGAIVKEINGVKYFKLQSKYPGDYTKNCGLLSNEIDENFFFLRSYDIQSMSVDEDRNLILTRVDGDKLIVNISEEIGYPTFEFIKEEGKIIVHYPEGTTDVMDGFLIEGQDIKVATDYTIKGDGRRVNPLRISEVERTGTYSPAKRFYDLTENGNTMPDGDKLGKGYRIVTKEYITPFGCLYDYFGVQEIQDALNECGSPWKVPSRKDWAALLNAAELCPDDRNHDTLEINEWTGKHAGARAKSISSWSGCTDEEDGWSVQGIDNLPSTGSFGTFHVIPIGYGEGSRGPIGKDIDFDIEGIRLLSSYWTMSPTNSKLKSNVPNIYTRTFAYDTRKVLQESSKPSSRLSLRLVKDFEFDAFNEYENILGHSVPCVLISNPDVNYCKIWTSINIGFTEPQYSGVTSDTWSGLTDEDRQIKEVFYINEWNGAEWIKKEMKPGDSVVILDFDGDQSTSGDTYHEWRIYENEDGTVELIDTAEALKKEFQKEIDEINEKIDDLSGATEEIKENLEDEIARAQSAETMLAEAIDELDEKIDNETARAQSAETALQEAIDELDEKIDNETARAQSAETALQEAIDVETERAMSAETMLQQEIDSIEVSAITPSSDDILASYALYVNGEQRGVTIDVPKDDVQAFERIETGWSGTTIDETTGEYTSSGDGETEVLLIVYKNSEDKYLLAEVNIENLLIENEIGDGLIIENHIVRVLIDPESDDFLTVSSAGTKLSGVAKTFDNIAKDIIGASGNPYDGYDIDFYDVSFGEPVTYPEINYDPDFDITKVGTINGTEEDLPNPKKWHEENPDKTYLRIHDETKPIGEEDSYYKVLTTNAYIPEDTTIVDAIKNLDKAIQDETNQRIVSDNILNEKIEDEGARAQSAETALQEAIYEVDEKIDAETERAMSAETALQEAIDAETERAMSAETALQEAIYEVDEKIDAETERAMSAETALQEAIDAETERAQSAETALQEAIDAETERAMSAETMIQQEIDSVSGEVTTLSGTVQDFSAATVNEIARLDGKDIADSGADHSLSVTQGLSLERENGEKVEINIDTNFGLLPDYE